MRNLRSVIIVLTSIVLVGFAVNVFAHGGGMMGRGDGRGYKGQGYHHRGGYGPRYYDQLSEKEVKQLEQVKEKFFNETSRLRDEIFDKKRELRDELTQDEPDATKASKLQKEISGLQSQFDQKRIDHMLELKKINPDIGRGYGRGHIHDGPMMGYGPRGNGHCWR
jgi:Spy/CpxP family protein refolding chaperone